MQLEKLPLGGRIRTIPMRGFGLRARDYSHDSVERVTAALNKARAPLPPARGHVAWVSAPVAFTLPGRHAYVSRRLIDACRSDAPLAFALAHEIAHHDLGHTERIGRIVTVEGADDAPNRRALTVLDWLSRRLYSGERDVAADAYALDLCVKAGYDAKECVECLTILTRYALDRLEHEPAAAESNAAGGADSDLRLWRARYPGSHPALFARRRILLAKIAAMETAEV